MRAKYVITGLLLLGGVLFGAWNWMNYLKKNPTALSSRLQALRPPSREEEQFKAQNDSAPAGQPQSGTVTAQPGGPPADSSVAGKLNVPETLRRNPFITPEEELSIAKGVVPEIQTPAQQAEAQPAAVNLPEVRVQALIQDNVTGRYMAIIGGKNYGRGDRVGEERIAEITGKAIVLEFEGRRREIPVGTPADSLPDGTRIIRKKP